MSIVTSGLDTIFFKCKAAAPDYRTNPSVDCGVRYSNVSIRLQSLWEIASFPRLEVGCWPSDICGMVGPP